MTTFCKTLIAAAEGAVTGTFANLGDITLRSDAREVLAIIAIAAVDKLTTVEGNAHVLRLLSSDLGIGTQTFSFGNTYGNGPATHNGGLGVSATYIPLSIPAFGKEVITVEATVGPTTVTENEDLAVGILYRDQGPIPAINRMAINLGTKAPAAGGVYDEIADISTGTSTVFTATGKTIPGWGKAITNIQANPVLDAIPIVDEPLIAKYILRSTIPNFEPQEYPACVGVSSALGTTTEVVQTPPLFPYPVYIPLTGQTETMHAYGELSGTITGAVGHMVNYLFTGNPRGRGI